MIGHYLGFYLSHLISAMSCLFWMWFRVSTLHRILQVLVIQPDHNHAHCYCYAIHPDTSNLTLPRIPWGSSRKKVIEDMTSHVQGYRCAQRGRKSQWCFRGAEGSATAVAKFWKASEFAPLPKCRWTSSRSLNCSLNKIMIIFCDKAIQFSRGPSNSTISTFKTNT